MYIIKLDSKRTGGIKMVAEKPISISAESRTRIANGEPLFDEAQNLVVISAYDYAEMLKAKEKEEYRAEINRRAERLKRGEGIHKTMEELRAME